MNDFVEVQRVVRVMIKRWWIVVILVILGAAGGYSASRIQAPVYQATTTLLVGQLMQSTSLDRDDVQISVSFAQTYSDIAIRYPVLQGVVDKLQLRESWQSLKDRVKVTFVEGTQLIVIRVEDISPERAQQIAAEIANQLVLISPTGQKAMADNGTPDFVQQQVEYSQTRIMGIQSRIAEIDAALAKPEAAGIAELQAEKISLERMLADYVKNFVDLTNLSFEKSEPNSLSIIEPAQPGMAPIRPRTELYILLGGALGLVLALTIVFLWETMGSSVKTEERTRLPQASAG